MGIVLRRIGEAAAAAFIALAAFPHVTAARTHEVYLADLRKTSVEFSAFQDDSVDFNGEEIINAADSLLKQTAGLFPSNEEIDFLDQKIPVDNSWIAEYAVSFSRETDPSKRKKIIISIGERFEAIAVQVERLDFLDERETTKDEQKRRLAEILKKEEYRQADEGGESLAARFYRAVENWISSLFPEFKPPNPSKSADLAGLKTVLQVLIFSVAGGLLVYLLVRFGPQFIKRYKKESNSLKTRLILGEEIGPDATTANLFAEAELLAGKGDIRGAIRKGYISLLFELSERKMIGLAKHKTNRDYLGDLAKHEHVRSSVGGLTRNYERHWYGGQEAEDRDWNEFRQGYMETLSR